MIQWGTIRAIHKTLTLMVDRTARQIVSDLIPGDNKNSEDAHIVEQHIRTLLRAYHRAVVRLVQQTQRWKPEHSIGAMTTDGLGHYINIHDLLAALAKWKEERP